MKTEDILCEVCSACDAAAGIAPLSFSFRSVRKCERLISGRLMSLCGVLVSEGTDRRGALAALDTAAAKLEDHCGKGIVRISAISPAALASADESGFRFEQEFEIIFSEEGQE